jgi:hypothetical protein
MKSRNRNAVPRNVIPPSRNSIVVPTLLSLFVLLLLAYAVGSRTKPTMVEPDVTPDISREVKP